VATWLRADGRWYGYGLLGDGQGFGDLVPGDAITQTSAVDEMIASEGTASHYSDYSQPVDYYPEMKDDLSEPPSGDEHPDECVADYMKTSQSAYGNYYGWSTSTCLW
jgi:hypothetical protein